MFVVFDIFLLISVAALAIAQASQVARNVTTNELANWHRWAGGDWVPTGPADGQRLGQRKWAGSRAVWWEGWCQQVGRPVAKRTGGS